MKRLTFLSVHEMLSLDANSRLADSSSATPVLKLTCPSLVRLDPDMKLQPAVADRWETDAEHRTFRFHIRPDQKFHSGRAVTAGRVADSYRRLFDSRVGSLLAEDYAGMESIEALPDDVVQFRFDAPFPAFLHHLAGRTHISDDCQTQPVGAGAFEVTEWVRGDRLVLRRFADYRGPNPAEADEIVVRWAPDGAERMAIIEAGEADIVEAVPAKAADDLQKRGVLNCATTDTMRKLSLCFNCAMPPFNDPRVRLAASHSVDRAAIVSEFFGAYGEVFDTAYPPTSPFGTEVEPIVFDPDRARTLIREAGLSGGVRVEAIATNVAPVPAVAAMVADQLRLVGIDLDIRTYSDPPWWPLVYLDTEWQAAFQGMGPRAHPDILLRREYMTNGSFNPVGYSNPELDAVIRKARVTINEREQAALYRDAQKILRSDLPYLPLYRNAAPAGWKPDVIGFRPHPLGYWELEPCRMAGWS